MTSCEAIWQFPFYNNSIHWAVYLAKMNSDHCFLLVGQQQNFPLDLSKNWTRWLCFIICHLALPDTPSCIGSPGMECRTTEYFYWGIKRKIKALGIRNSQCSISSGSPRESEGESSSNTIMTFIEMEREQMVKIPLISELHFWRATIPLCWYWPPLLSLFFFLLSLKVHSPRLMFSNILNFKTLGNAGVSYVCGYFRKSLMALSSVGFGSHRFFPGFWPFQRERNASCQEDGNST